MFSHACTLGLLVDMYDDESAREMRHAGISISRKNVYITKVDGYDENPVKVQQTRVNESMLSLTRVLHTSASLGQRIHVL